MIPPFANNLVEIFTNDVLTSGTPLVPPTDKILSVVILEKIPVEVSLICQFFSLSTQRISALVPPARYNEIDPLTAAANPVPIVNTFEANTVVPVIVRLPAVCMSPLAIIFPPTNTSFAIPIPPPTINAPLTVDVDCVVSLIKVAPPIVVAPPTFKVVDNVVASVTKRFPEV